MSKAGGDDVSPWYLGGLQFECTQCGACCSGEPGYVWVDRNEIKALAYELRMDAITFQRKFVRQVGRDKSLIERPNGDCILLDPETRRCKAYRARPVQCRTWPFWDSNLATNRDWQTTCKVCPGAGTGKLYSLTEIDAARKQRDV